MAKARIAARQHLAAKVSTAKLERLAERLERTSQSLNSSDVPGRPRARVPKRAWLWALEARQAHRAARVRSMIELAGALYAPEPLHSVRIALKKLRYSVELSGETGRTPVKATVGVLKAAQDLLGHLHDLQVLLMWVRHVQASLPLASLSDREALDALAHAIEDDCRLLHASYMRDRAALIAIADRMGATGTSKAAPTGPSVSAVQVTRTRQAVNAR